MDLLPDREEETLRKWLLKRPEIKVMTRDRFSNYQKAMANGAPQAIQVADRWHLLKNLGESVQKVLVTRRSEEHTSELQSLMRISYAVFSLKKKKPGTQ